MNLGDPELELIDPTPNIHSLFVHFDKIFFWEKLSNRTAVRWSKRMYSCAGTCSYGGKYSMCDIALSEPLLKLRPRKDLIETLLHEMIHAYLFIMNKDRDRDGHGPNFRKHMHRINESAGLNITIYHDFHDEVDLYRTHWWRCDGPCQLLKPYFGVVRRSSNRAPGPSDYWWENHKRHCHGKFVKIKGPEKSTKQAKKQPKMIDSYFPQNTSNSKAIAKPKSSILKPQNSIISPNNVLTSTPKYSVKSKSPNLPELFSGEGQKVGGKKIEAVTDITETVRKIWAEKDFSTKNSETKSRSNGNSNVSKRPKVIPSTTPNKKMRKIDDFFKSPEKTNSTDSVLSESTPKCITALCPVCRNEIQYDNINNHLDECLNAQAIIDLTQEDNQTNHIPNEIITHSNLTNKTTSAPHILSYVNLVSSSDSEVDACNDQNVDTIKMNTLKTYATVDKVNIKDNEEIVDQKSDININTSKSGNFETKYKKECVCCGNNIDIPMADHLEECLSFFNDDSTIPEDGESEGYKSNASALDEDNDDIFDETSTHNSTGNKFPCPCCMKMVEEADMNDHLDTCLK